MNEPFDEFDRDGSPHGIHRSYHANGRLKQEVTWVHGVLHGVTRQWSEQGEMLGEYEMHDGDGVMCEWHENGVLKSQIYVVDKEFNGPLRSFDESGALIDEAWVLKGRPVSKKRYLSAQQKNPKLPPL